MPDRNATIQIARARSLSSASSHSDEDEDALSDDSDQHMEDDGPAMDNILSGIQGLNFHSSSRSKHRRDKNLRTKRTLLAFEMVAQRIDDISKALEVFTMAPSREEFNRIREMVTNVHEIMEGHKRSTPSIDAKRSELIPRVRALDDRLQEVGHILPESRGPKEYSIDHHFTDPSVFSSSPAAQMALFIGAVCNVVFGVSRRGGDFIMSAISLLLWHAFQKRDGTINAAQENIRAEIPHRIEEALKSFKLGGYTTTYAMCPSCHKGHAPQFEPLSTIPSYPQYCVNEVLERGVCGKELLDRDRPILPFVYHHLDDYVGSLLSQRAIEQELDHACDDVMASITANHDPPAFIHDIFRAEFMKTFEGPGGHLFVDRNGECRLAFSLCVDFFNVEGLRVRGQTASSGIIALACLNLPFHMRYQPEYMYLCGIIPGPQAPHGSALNHYLSPLVDDLLDSWQKGVHYTRTASHSEGRLSRVAVVCEACDLIGARHIAGLAPCTSNHFCSVCELTGVNTNLGRYDRENWVKRDAEEIRRLAVKWRDATTLKEREKLYKDHGVMWTELYRLPYYDPTCQLTVDPMHCILEGLVQFHFREVLKLTTANAKTKAPTTSVAFTYPFRQPLPADNPGLRTLPPRMQLDTNAIKDVAHIHRTLTSPLFGDSPGAIPTKEVLFNRLHSRRKLALQFVHEDLKLRPLDEDDWRIRDKDFFVCDLVKWRLHWPYEPVDQPSPKLVTTAVMSRIRDVISTMVTPSWLGSVPFNFGDKRAGTLKAAEWRTLATVYLPVALVSIWGEGSIHDNPDTAAVARQTLDHTMALVSAVTIVCYRSSSSVRSEAFLKYILEYNRDLTIIHKDVRHRPNHHMAVHVYDFMVLFGPIRSWWTFPFERLIGRLQQLPHNDHFGVLESTLMHVYNRFATLKRWLASSECPEALQQGNALLDKAFSVRDDDNADEEEITTALPLVTPPSDLLPLVGACKVTLHARFRDKNVVYARSSTHMGNSLVYFYPGGSTSAIPGSIEYIFRTSGGPFTFAVRRQLPLVDDSLDPFRHYPHFPAKLYSSSLSSRLEVVQVEWVMAHFARWQFSKSSAVVLPLWKD